MRDDIFELEIREYEEFCLNASYAMWQEKEIYGEMEVNNVCSE